MGFIGIDRGIREHWIYQDAEYFKVWFEMLWLARYSKEPHNELIDGELIKINYGEFIFGRIKWSSRLKISEQRLRTLIKKLIQDKMIEAISNKRNRKFTLYKITNYEKFNQQSNQQTNQLQQGIDEETNQLTNPQPTSCQPAANQLPTTKEQGNKENKDNKDNKVKDKTFYSEFVSMPPHLYQKLIERFGESMTKEMIDILDAYKGAHNKKYADDYRAILAWVVGRIKERENGKHGRHSETNAGPNGAVKAKQFGRIGSPKRVSVQSV